MNTSAARRVLTELIAQRGGVLPENLGWGCAAHFPKSSLTQFMAKICDLWPDQVLQNI